MDIIVGTAGHIDHGKTALIKGLTGIDTDRLPEEKDRGITIDLGFAELEIDGTRIGFVDVPGHERFVKNMLAGASGMDLVLFVVAADEGIMPQTREHFDICQLLEIKHGLIALTKRDLVDNEMFELVKSEVAEFVAGTFLDGAPIVGVSARSGDGIEELRRSLAATASAVKPRSDLYVTRLPIDRSFAIKGFGSVVTGTLSSGNISEGNELELLPVGRNVRVRGVQSHGRKVATASAGRRTAVNLAGIDHHDIVRGMLLTEPGALHPGQSYDAEVEVLSDSAKPLRSRQRVRLHIGTAEVLTRIIVVSGQAIDPGEKGFVQLRLESPIAAILGERFIIRSYSPQVTIAGGTILCPSETKSRRRTSQSLFEYLSLLCEARHDVSETLKVLLERSAALGMNRAEISAITGWTVATLASALKQLQDTGSLKECAGVYLSHHNFNALEDRALNLAESIHDANRLISTIPLDKLRTIAFRSVRSEVEKAVLQSLNSTNKLTIEGDAVKLTGRNVQLSESESTALSELREIFESVGLDVPKPDEVIERTVNVSGAEKDIVKRLFQQLLSSGELIRISPDIVISANIVEGLIEKVRRFAGTSPDRLIDVPKFKDIAGVSRKYAIPLLEYFDQRKITARRGDKRLVI